LWAKTIWLFDDYIITITKCILFLESAEGTYICASRSILPVFNSSFIMLLLHISISISISMSKFCELIEISDTSVRLDELPRWENVSQRINLQSQIRPNAFLVFRSIQHYLWICVCVWVVNLLLIFSFLQLWNMEYNMEEIMV